MSTLRSIAGHQAEAELYACAPASKSAFPRHIRLRTVFVVMSLAVSCGAVKRHLMKRLATVVAGVGQLDRISGGRRYGPGCCCHDKRRQTSCTRNKADGLERYIISIHNLLIRHLCNSSSTCKRSVNEQLSPKTIIRHMISLSQLSRHKEICSSKIGKK